MQDRPQEAAVQELTEDVGHAVAPAEQPDGGLEQLCPGQAAVAVVGLGVTTELPGHPYPLGPCRVWQGHATSALPARLPSPCAQPAPRPGQGSPSAPHLASPSLPPSHGSQSELSGTHT